MYRFTMLVDKMIGLASIVFLIAKQCSGQYHNDDEILNSLRSMVDKGWYPGQARLASFGRDKFNSVLVGDGWVLTAASVFRNNYNPFVWSSWVASRGAFTPGEQTTFHVQNTFLYGGYKESSSDNDIALVKLQWGPRFMPNFNIQARTEFVPVNLPVAGQLDENQTCFLIGWNNTDSGVPSPQDLRYTPVTLLDSAQCNRVFGTNSSMPGQLCLASDNLDDGPCKGDQGSPVLCQYGNSWTVTAIVSDLFGCGVRGHAGTGIFIDVSHYLPWINKIMDIFSSNAA